MEEIIGGLRNAVERGASLEQAVQSFISAGYNPIEVKQAAQSLSQISTLRPVNGRIPEMPRLPQAEQAMQRQQPGQIQKGPQVLQQQAVQQQQTQRMPNVNVQMPRLPQQPMQQQTTMPQMPSMQMQGFNNPFGQQQRQKPRSNKNFLIMLLIFVLVALVGGLIYIIFWGEKFLDSLLG